MRPHASMIRFPSQLSAVLIRTTNIAARFGEIRRAKRFRIRSFRLNVECYDEDLTARLTAMIQEKINNLRRVTYKEV